MSLSIRSGCMYVLTRARMYGGVGGRRRGEERDSSCVRGREDAEAGGCCSDMETFSDAT